MKQIFYKKIGRRYIPAHEYDQELLDSFPKGNHLVMTYPGGQSRRYNIVPALAPMIAAGRYAEDQMLDAMRKASEARPSKQPVTEGQRKAWENIKKAYGDDIFYLTYPSNYDIVQAGINAMQDEVNKMMGHPSVRAAYDEFLLVCGLVREKENG